MPQGEMTIREAMGYHPLAQMFGEVLEDLGGKEYIKEWAVDNQKGFLTLMTKMTPSLTPHTGHQGDVHLHVHQTLGRTALDGE